MDEALVYAGYPSLGEVYKVFGVVVGSQHSSLRPKDESMEPLLPLIDPAQTQADLRGFEILQKPYTNGLFKEQAPTQRVSYLPGGFTPETVLSGDLTQVEDADGPLEGEFWPQKTRLCLQFCNTAYDTQLLSVQRRVRLTRGEFAIRASEEIKKMLGELPQFPFAFDQVRVLCIDVCSRGTLQPRIFVDPFALAPEQLANLTETLRK